jgi:hypothetical protein
MDLNDITKNKKVKKTQSNLSHGAGVINFTEYLKRKKQNEEDEDSEESDGNRDGLNLASTSGELTEEAAKWLDKEKFNRDKRSKTPTTISF